MPSSTQQEKAIKREVYFRHYIEYFLFSFILFFFSLISHRLAFKLGKILGHIAHFVGLRKKIVAKNLDIAFANEKTKAEKNQITKAVYENIGLTLVEIILMYSLPQEEIKNHIEFQGLDYLEKEIQKGKGLLITTGHFSNWELLPTGLSTVYKPMYGYIGRQMNPLFDNRLNKNRQRFGLFTISRSKSAYQKMSELLSSNNMLGLINDINSPKSDLFVDFFGKKAATAAGAAALSIKTGAPVVFSWGLRIAPFKHKCFISPVEFKASGDKEADVHNLTSLIIKKVEEVARKHPEHYWWVHKRWRTRPRGEQNLY